jgi:peptide chain release factor 2
MQGCKIRYVTSGSIFDAGRMRQQLVEIEKQAADPNLWSNPQKSQQVMREKKRLEEVLSTEAELTRRSDDISAYFELAREGEVVDSDLRREIDSLRELVDRLETETLLSGENDARNAIVTIHPGAGGTESQDWADMLLRMYLRWAERQGFQTVLYDYQPGEEAGLKSATFAVNGEYAYGLLTSEIGVHRLVRISPFDQAKRRHTSFASVFVSPEIDDSIEVVIKPEEIRVDTYRSSGKGGQHVNTTDSAVRITHIPTGLVASCQNERSQHKNRERAMSMLRSKLYEFEMEKKREATRKIEDSKLDIDFGSQIRSYVLQPYRLIKDHRTKVEIGDVDRVLDGDLQPFIRGYLRMRRGEKQ